MKNGHLNGRSEFRNLHLVRCRLLHGSRKWEISNCFNYLKNGRNCSFTMLSKCKYLAKIFSSSTLRLAAKCTQTDVKCVS